MTSGTGIVIHPEFMTDSEEGLAIFVETADPESAAAALRQVSPRLALVAADGREFPDEEAAEEAAEIEDGNFYTPSYVSEVTVRPSGALIYLDTDAGTPAAQKAMMTRVIAESLGRHGVVTALIRPPHPGE